MKPANCPRCKSNATKLMALGEEEKHYCFMCKKEFERSAF